MNCEFHPAARLEYREAALFYEAHRTGLGAAFTIEVEAALRRILESPKRWRLIEQDVRRYLTHTFPYGVLYTIEEESILIVAVMHLQRRPGYWLDRLSSSRG